MHNVSWQSHHPSDDNGWPAAPDDSDELERGQRQRSVRSQQSKQRPQPPRPALPKRSTAPGPPLKGNALLRARLLRLLVVAVVLVLLLVLVLGVMVPEWRASSTRNAALARSRAALRRAGILVDELPSDVYTNETALQHLVAFYSTEGSDSVDATPADTTNSAEQQQLLVVHVAHGLSNRVRAFASALVVAHHFHLALRVIWLPDHHCQATFTELFTLPNTSDTSISHTVMDTWHRFQPHHLCSTHHCSTAATHLSPSRYTAYHYITPANQAADYHPPIYPPPTASHGVYVHASSRLNHTAVHSDRDVWPGMVALRPAVEVSELVAAFEKMYGGGGSGGGGGGGGGRMGSGVVGLHVRMLEAEQEIAGLQSDEYSASAWAALAAARRLSSVDYFQQLVSTTLETAPDTTFYIATDSATAIEQLRRQFGSHVFLTIRDALPTAAACDGHDRGVACMRVALADQLLLARCRTIYGSVWSSYSEVAGLWRMSQVVYPEGAVQQVKAAGAMVAAAAHNVSDGVG